MDPLAHRELPPLGEALVMGGTAPGLGLVEQTIDLLELLEHGGPVFLELGRAGIEAGAEPGREQHVLPPWRFGGRQIG